MTCYSTGKDVLNFNLTQVLMQQCQDTERKWTEQYYKDQQQLSKRRVPFVPLAIRNHTGCDLTFATMTVTSPRLLLSENYAAAATAATSSSQRLSEWKPVRAGSELPFLIDEPEKTRGKVRT